VFQEISGVTPDLMTLAKPLAGGLPIGAVLLTEVRAHRVHRTRRFCFPQPGMMSRQHSSGEKHQDFLAYA